MIPFAWHIFGGSGPLTAKNYSEKVQVTVHPDFPHSLAKSYQEYSEEVFNKIHEWFLPYVPVVLHYNQEPSGMHGQPRGDRDFYSWITALNSPASEWLKDSWHYLQYVTNTDRTENWAHIGYPHDETHELVRKDGNENSFVYKEHSYFAEFEEAGYETQLSKMLETLKKYKDVGANLVFDESAIHGPLEAGTIVLLLYKMMGMEVGVEGTPEKAAPWFHYLLSYCNDVRVEDQHYEQPSWAQDRWPLFGTEEFNRLYPRWLTTPTNRTLFPEHERVNRELNPTIYLQNRIEQIDRLRSITLGSHNNVYCGLSNYDIIAAINLGMTLEDFGFSKIQ